MKPQRGGIKEVFFYRKDRSGYAKVAKVDDAHGIEILKESRIEKDKKNEPHRIGMVEFFYRKDRGGYAKVAKVNILHGIEISRHHALKGH